MTVRQRTFARALGREMVKTAGYASNMGLGALIGGGLGGLGSYLLNDEADGWDHALAAGGGALGGAGLGGLLTSVTRPGDVYNSGDDKAKVLERAKAHKDRLDAPWHGGSLAPRTMNLYDEISPIYAHAPGGLDEAISRAELAKAENRARGFDSSEMTITPDVGKLADAVRRDVQVKADPRIPKELRGYYVHDQMDGVLGYLSRLTGFQPTPDTIGMNIAGTESDKLHELTHAAEMGFPLFGGARRVDYNDHPASTANDSAGYLEKPVEVDARLAQLKRLAVEATGKHVDDEESARAAFDLLDDMNYFDMDYGLQQLKDVRDTSGDKRHPGYGGNTINEYMMKRILELVQNKPASAGGVA
jgi:hypothetical protein